MKTHDLPSSAELEDQPLDLGLGADVDAAGRLVEDQDLRVRREPAGQDHLLLVAAAQVPDELLGVGRGDLQQLDVLVGDRPLLGGSDASAASPDRPGPRGRCSRARSGRRRSPRPCGPRDRARRHGRSIGAARTARTARPVRPVTVPVSGARPRTGGRRSRSGPNRAARPGRRPRPRGAPGRTARSSRPARARSPRSRSLALAAASPRGQLDLRHVVELGQLTPEHLGDELEARQRRRSDRLPTRRPLRRTVIRSATA